MNQVSTLGLIWMLLKSFAKRGNVPVYYHCPPPCLPTAPFEIERLEVRETSVGEKLTIV